MRILVTGITGAIGSRLAPRLLAAGYEVCALTRSSDAARLAQVPTGVRLMTGDAVSGIGLPKALRGVDVAYYLIHSMEPGAEERFGVRERRAAENFAAAAVQGSCRPDRLPRRARPRAGLAFTAGTSAHLASRLVVERTLLEAVPDSVALRASIVIGARSRSFRFLVRLVERMPVLLIPAWRDHRTAPVDERDVITCLARAATPPGRRPLAGPRRPRRRHLRRVDRADPRPADARPAGAEHPAIHAHADRQPGLSPDRRRGARADRTADGRSRHRPAAARGARD